MIGIKKVEVTPLDRNIASVVDGTAGDVIRSDGNLYSYLTCEYVN